MPKDFADHHDAELVLKAYELRRDPVMRESRRVLTLEFWPRSWGEVEAVLRWDHPHNAVLRQVTTYWELVYGMAKYGIVNAEYLVDSSGGEGFILLAKMSPFLADIRKTLPRTLRNTEWAATETEVGRQLFPGVKARVEQMMKQRQADG